VRLDREQVRLDSQYIELYREQKRLAKENSKHRRLYGKEKVG
jgi:hypothetical protein